MALIIVSQLAVHLAPRFSPNCHNILFDGSTPACHSATLIVTDLLLPLTVFLCFGLALWTIEKGNSWLQIVARAIGTPIIGILGFLIAVTPVIIFGDPSGKPLILQLFLSIYTLATALLALYGSYFLLKQLTGKLARKRKNGTLPSIKHNQ
jgi:hypothetical protein